jgi:predicted DNA-binding transcriptional regulator AlpA
MSIKIHGAVSMPATLTARLLSSREAAAVIGIQEQTLALWRCLKRSPQPKYIKVGSRAIRYRLADLEAFLQRGEVDDVAPE